MEVTGVTITDDAFGNKTYYGIFMDKGTMMCAMYQTNGMNYPHITKDEWIEMIKEDNGITK